MWLIINHRCKSRINKESKMSFQIEAKFEKEETVAAFQVKCATQEDYELFNSVLKENKHPIEGLTIFVRASEGNKSGVEIFNFVVEFGSDLAVALKEEAISGLAAYYLGKIQGKKQGNDTKVEVHINGERVHVEKKSENDE